jgi:hypothetical protein
MTSKGIKGAGSMKRRSLFSQLAVLVTSLVATVKPSTATVITVGETRWVYTVWFVAYQHKAGGVTGGAGPFGSYELANEFVKRVVDWGYETSIYSEEVYIV